MGLYYNNTVIIADIPTDMRALVSLDKTLFMVPGPSVAWPNPTQWWMYNGTSTATDNGTTILKPTALSVSDPGRFLILTINAVPPTMTLNSASARSFNSAFQINTAKDTIAYYSVRAVTNLTLTTGQTCKVTLEISPDGSTGWTATTATEGGLTGTLVVGLNLNAANGGAIAGFVPRGYYARLNTTGTSGAVTPTLVSQQEVLFG